MGATDVPRAKRLAEFNVVTLSIFHPKLYRARQKGRQCNSVAADQQLALRFERCFKGHEPGTSVGTPPTLHFNRLYRQTTAHDEIHFHTSVAPIENFTVSGRGSIRQMRAH